MSSLRVDARINVEGVRVMRDLVTNIQCPNCRHNLRVKIKEMVPGRSKRCGCGCVVRFEGDNGRQVQLELGKLERELRSLNKKVPLRF